MKFSIIHGLYDKINKEDEIAILLSSLGFELHFENEKSFIYISSLADLLFMWEKLDKLTYKDRIRGIIISNDFNSEFYQIQIYDGYIE